jgi:Retroviral aspartyl protease/Ty3 transposon capsid-like protein
MHQVPEPYKTHLATIQFSSQASEWYDCYLIDHEPPPWTELVRLVRKRFQRVGVKNGMEELMTLHHTTTVSDFIELFERLRAKLLLENRQFTETDFIDAFTGGLKPEIKSFVKVFRPQTLEDAYDHALNLEGAVESQMRKIKFNSKPYPVNVTNKPQNQPSLSKNTLMDQRRLLGLCFKCGEKYYPGHQCRVKVQMLLGQEDTLLEEACDEQVIHQSDTDQDAPIEEAIVSMHVTHPSPSMQSMRFRGKVGTHCIYALLDSGSTHSFIDPSVLQGQNFQISVTKPLVVMVANGERMVTDTHCSSLTFSLQGHEFKGDLRLLQIKGYDVILGLDWLS